MATNNVINSKQTLDSGSSPTFVTVTASLNGNASTATTATNANNVATTQVTTNASYFPLMVSSSSNSNQASDLAIGFTFNPSSNTLNTSNIQASSALQIGTITNNSPLTVQVGGGTTYATALAAYFGSVVGGVAGNLYHITIAKGSYEAALFGINKNTTTGNNVPANYVYISTYSNTGGIALGQGNNAGLPNNAALIVTNQVNIPNLTVSSLVETDSSNNLVSTNTLSSIVLGNIPKVTVTKLTSGSGTYTPPANCTHIRVRMWGAGGGAGGLAGNLASGGASGGGASGGYIESIITSPTATSYSVGAGGAGGAAGNNQGVTGGNTTFGTFTAAGGFGGSGYNSGLGSGTALGGNSQTNSGSPNISFLGNPGLPGITISTSVVVSGAGAAAPGGGGAATGVNGSFSGLNGASPGAGGGGAASTNGSSFAGGNGAAGLIVIEEYYNG